VVEGAIYSLILKAKNKWGYATEWSEPCSVFAATVPEQIEHFSTRLEPKTGGVLVEWLAPHHNGSPLTSFTVQILTAGDEWHTVCEGLLELNCLIPMQTIWQEPIALSFQESISVQVAASNALGQSLWSQPNADLFVRQVPVKMSPPTRGNLTSEKQIEVDWLPLTEELEIGFSPITSYQLVWDSASGNTNVIASQNLKLTKLLTGLLRGQDYKFKVRAENVYGYGEFSDVVTIRASYVPDTMLPVSSIISL
jgi:hypothetical protein